MQIGNVSRASFNSFRKDAGYLAALSCILVAIHFAVGDGYGFHRDELQFLDSSRHLAWGYVAYPPMTAFVGRLAIAVFGVSVHAYRLPAMFAAMLSLVLTGLTARELGGRRSAQVIAFFIALASQVILASLMIYVVWDFLAWTMVCFFIACLLRTGDGRWWLAVGAGIGIGLPVQILHRFCSRTHLGWNPHSSVTAPPSTRTMDLFGCASRVQHRRTQFVMGNTS